MATMPVSQIPAYWCAIQPDRTAISHEGDSLTWRELETSTNRLARAYVSLGVKPNDMVTVALPNGIEFIQVCFAIWKAGATPQPVSAKLPKIERDQILELARPSVVIGAQSDTCESIPPGFQPNSSLFDAELDMTHTAALLKAMTSGGSTGRPKLIITEEAAEWDPDAEYFVQTRGSVLVPGPLYHNGPFMWAMGGLFKGNHVTITTHFDAEEILRIIEQHRVDTLYTVPTMMQRIWKLPTEIRESYDLSSLLVLWHTAAPCPPWLKEAFIGWLGPEHIWEVYSSTEAQAATIIGGTEWLEHRGSVGKCIPTCEMKVVDDTGTTLPPGEIGDVYVRAIDSAVPAYRYIGAEAKLSADGWESFGDMGYMDADGYLYLSDRRTDMIISGGANIFPAEVEAAIDAFPGVRSSAVIGLPDSDMGQVTHAIVDAPNNDVAECSLIEHLSERLVKYKLPRSIEFVSTSLRDDAGKVRRKALRDERIKS